MRVAFFDSGDFDFKTIRVEVDSRAITFYLGEDKDDFYWIVSQDWITHSEGDIDFHKNWIYHMRQKRWFTEAMKEFIDKCLKVINTQKVGIS